MTKELFTYEELCKKYGQKTIDHLDNFIYWQLQNRGKVNYLGKEYTFEDYLEMINKKAAPFAGYDYEDDQYTFNQWYENQSEIEYFKQNEY